jgi:hypothetical protein
MKADKRNPPLLLGYFRRDAEILNSGGSLVSTLYAAVAGWFAGRPITAHNIASSANPLSSPQGLNEVARMLAGATITARIRSTVELDGVGQMLEKLRHGGFRGKAVIRLWDRRLACVWSMPIDREQNLRELRRGFHAHPVALKR